MLVRLLASDMFFLRQRVQLSGGPEETHEDVNKYKLHTIISYFRVPSGIIFFKQGSTIPSKYSKTLECFQPFRTTIATAKGNK